MKSFWNIREAQELLAITHNTDSIFEHESALFKPCAVNEIKRTAQIISLYPNKAIHIEITLPSHHFLAKDHLYKIRIQAIKKIMLQHGIDFSLVQTTTQRGVSTLPAKDTISFKVMDGMAKPSTWVDAKS